jgi:ketopantoate reductase
MQNGINPPLLQEKVGAERTVGIAIRMGCRRVAPGHVQTATRGHLYIGHLHGRTTPQLNRLHELLNAVIDTEISSACSGASLRIHALASLARLQMWRWRRVAPPILTGSCWRIFLPKWSP